MVVLEGVAVSYERGTPVLVRSLHRGRSCPVCCRANLEQIRQSGPDSGLGFRLKELLSCPLFARQWLHAVAMDVFHAACRFQSTRPELGEIILLGHFTRATRLTSLVTSLPYHPRRIPDQGAGRARAGKRSRGLRAGGFARCVVLRGVHDAVFQRAGELCHEQADAGGARGVAACEKLVV